MNKEKYDSKCLGVVKELKNRGLDFPTIVVVEYEVNGKKYILNESLKFKSKKIKIGFLPIGQKQVPKVECAKGKNVTILYNGNNPKKAHIKDNDGLNIL